MLTLRPDFLDPVPLLQVHQPISLTTKRVCIEPEPFLAQILADQIEHRGEGAKIVVSPDMEF